MLFASVGAVLVVVPGLVLPARLVSNQASKQHVKVRRRIFFLLREIVCQLFSTFLTGHVLIGCPLLLLGLCARPFSLLLLPLLSPLLLSYFLFAQAPPCFNNARSLPRERYRNVDMRMLD